MKISDATAINCQNKSKGIVQLQMVIIVLDNSIVLKNIQINNKFRLYCAKGTYLGAN